MDYLWLTESNSNLTHKDTAIIVPTRSLATSINERIARANIAQGKTVWEAPSVFVWSDYLRVLWQSNRNLFSGLLAAHTLISPQQALLLWNQVIEVSRREESELTLLNVQQTSRAVQRSWRLICDWQVSLNALKEDHVADTGQFILWVEAYCALLEKRALIDESSLLKKLSVPDLQHPCRRLLWVSYDLITNAQKTYISNAVAAGIEVEQIKPNKSAKSQQFFQYDNTKLEIKGALEHARQLLEKDEKHTLSIVIPDLQHRYQQVQELARDVFYPASSPLDIQHNNKVYQFSLGQPISEWAAIEAALGVISLLKNRCNLIDLGFILRNQFLGLCAQHPNECRQFEYWLKRQRIHDLLFDNLPDLYRQWRAADQVGDEGEDNFLITLERLVVQRQSIHEQLSLQKAQSGFAALSFNHWLQVFNDWLDTWGWRSNTNTSEMSGVQIQLQLRWKSLLEEFAGLASVQKRAGLSRALEVLHQMAHSAIFLPKAAVAPIVISGVLEAVGREVSTCILTGMHQDYPAPPSNDAFAPNRLLVLAGHPEATAESGFQQATMVIENLLSCAQHHVVSYALATDQDLDLTQQCSALFKEVVFEPVSIAQSQGEKLPQILQQYKDVKGPAWNDPQHAKGGSRIFENQSLCAFKAFATHQLGFEQQDESEFGLDGLDRGNVLHHCLNLLWRELQTQSFLATLDDAARLSVIDKVLSDVMHDEGLALTSDKATLLKHEVPRLQAILLQWLEIESQRPTPFSVVEREEPREAELGGIRFRYIIDRVDVTEDGRSVIIDYKTGLVNRNDWIGERLKSPQMPLYALALDAAKQKDTSGIAFAQIKQGDSKYIELAETDVFRKARSKREQKTADSWLENRAAWPAIFEQLAKDFLAGEASVEPIDQQTCLYCKLQSLCRVSQLRAQS